MRLKTTFLILIAALLPCSANAQTQYKPEAYGLFKLKYEVSTYEGQQWFNVRNARLGFRGLISDDIRYSLQIEAGTQGSFGIVDAYVGYRFGKFDMIVGQQPFYFSSEVSKGAAGNYFANRSFVAKFITSYYGMDGGMPAYAAIGARDLGAMIQYKETDGLPFAISLGLFNGSGMQNPKWRMGANLAARFDVGGDRGFGASASYYGGNTMLGDRMDAWSASVRYDDGVFRAEAEYARRYLGFENSKDTLGVGVVYAMYRFPLAGGRVKSIAPIARFDFGDNVSFLNRDSKIEAFSGSRLTGGVTIGLNEKPLKSEIRLNYEHYLLRDRTSDYARNPLLHNKFVVEFFVNF